MAYLWKDRIVCYRCHRSLEKEQNEYEARKRAEEEPASEAQIRFLLHLGVHATPGFTMQEASVLIDKRLKLDLASEAQLRYLDRLGVQTTSELTKQQASDFIDKTRD